MTTFVFANNIDTTLASSISSSATSITLSSGTNLPALAAGQTFVVTLNDAATQQIFEIMYATAISGTTLTVSRAQEGTTAQAWAAGDYVFSGPTAGQMRLFYQGQSVGQGSVTSVGMSMPSGFSVSDSPITVAGTLSVTFASQNAGLFLATPVTGGAAGPSTWRSMAAADVNGALGYTAANDTAVVHLAGTETITGQKTFDDGLSLQASAVIGAAGGPEIDISLPSLVDSPYLFVSNTNGFGMYNSTTGFTFKATSTGFAISQPFTVTATGTFSGLVTANDGLTSTTGTFSGTVTSPTFYSTGSGAQLQVQDRTTSAASGGMFTNQGTITFYYSPNGSTFPQVAAFSTTAATFPGSVTCSTMNSTSSDRRLKRNIRKAEPRPLHRAVPFVSYVLKENGWHGLGSIAQRMQKVAPEHVGEFDWHGKKRLSLDYGRAAYEEAMWAGLALDKALDRIKVLERRLAALERRV